MSCIILPCRNLFSVFLNTCYYWFWLLVPICCFPLILLKQLSKSFSWCYPSYNYSCSFTFDTVSIVFPCHINSPDLLILLILSDGKSWVYLSYKDLPKSLSLLKFYHYFASFSWMICRNIHKNRSLSFTAFLCCVESDIWPVAHFHTPGVFLSENLSPEPHISVNLKITLFLLLFTAGYLKPNCVVCRNVTSVFL